MHKMVKRMYQPVISMAVSAAMIASCSPVFTQTAYAAVSSNANPVSVAPVAALQNGQRSDFIMGADVSEVYDLQKHNKKFYDRDGSEMSPLKVLQNHGVNYLRLRLWNDPTDAFGKPVGGGNTDLSSDIAIAKQAKALGMKVLLDFHYSDFWADPGKQNKPKAWKNDTGAVLQQDIYDYTYNVLHTMKAEGVLPNMVQIGNEINNGLLWPEGDKYLGADQSALLLQKASAAVRNADPNYSDPNRKIKIMIHLAGSGSGSADTFTTDFDTWTSGSTAVDFDIIGISHYPNWHGNIGQNATILNTLASRYNKPVIVAETSYAWTLTPGDDTINNFDRSSAYTAGYTPTPQGQAAEVRDIINNLANVPDQKGLGLFYWGADWLPGEETGWVAGQGSGWENQALFDYSGRALPSMDVFKMVRESGSIPTSSLVSAEPEYVTTTIGGALNLPSTVRGSYSDGYYKPVTVTSWDTSAVNFSEEGVYTANGRVGSNPTAASAVITVLPEQPAVINYVSNANVESGDTGWTNSNADIAKPKYKDGAQHGGDWTIHYWSGSAFNDATVSQTVYVPNGTYTLSVYGEADTAGGSAVPYLYAAEYDNTNPSAILTKNFVHTGWNSFKLYSLTVNVTSGKCTIGVNFNGAAGAWGDVDDFYFGLTPVTPGAHVRTQPVSVSSPGGAPLLDGAAVPASTPYMILSTTTPGATIYYTKDGSEPGYSSNSSTTLVYTGPIKVTGNSVIKTMATAPGYLNSDVTTSHFAVDYTNSGHLVPDGDFEQAATLGAWNLTGVAQGNDNSTFVFDSVQNATYGVVYAGASGFNYWSSSNYAFTLSQKVTGLSNGIYTLSAMSAGKDNTIINTVGKAVYNPDVATLTLSAHTSSTDASTKVINQGTYDVTNWNKWESSSVNDIYVTNGTADISFAVIGSADYWGWLDHVELVKTGELPRGGTSTGQTPGGGHEPDSPPVTVDNGILKVSPTTDNKGVASVEITSDDFKKAIEQAVDRIVSIAVKPSEGTKEVQVFIPVQQITEGTQVIDSIQVNTGLATISISPKLFLKSDGTAAKDVKLTVSVIDKTTLSAAVQEQLGSSSVYDINMIVDGNRVSSFKSTDGLQVAIAYTLKPGENPNKIIIYYVNDNGNLEVVKNGKFNTVTGEVVFKPKHFSKYAASFAKVTFKDTSEAEWATDSIEALAARGAINGIGNDHFNPNGGVTRAEFITMLMNAFDLVDPTAVSSLSDIKKDTWYSKPIASAQKLGITNGKDDGSFGVNDPITRQDMAVMSYRAAYLLKTNLDAGSNMTEFADQSDISFYAAGAVAAMQKAGIIHGINDNKFAPQEQSTRAQAATIIYNLYNKVN